MGSLDQKKVKGKIVVCAFYNSSGVAKSEAVLLAGGVGMIITSTDIPGDSITAEAFVLPAIYLSYQETSTFLSYMNSTT